jgi:N-acetylneuraminic acid mutarotase
LDACVDAVIISGGLDDQKEPIKSTVCFVPEDNNSWYTMSPLSSARYFNASAYCDGFLYCVGGWKKGIAIKSVERYDPVTNSWLNVCPLPQAGRWVRAVSLDGQVYVYGASGCMYRYTPSINIWTQITSTSEEIRFACLVTDSSSLYLVGGFDSYNGVRSACQKFDPESEKWTLLTPMNNQRQQASAVYKRKHIYVVGGLKNYGDDVALGSGEVYSIDHDVWETLPSLQFPRHIAGIACVWDDILIFGGAHRQVTQKSIEHYNEAKGKWEVLSDMPYRNCFSCSWVRIPKHWVKSQNKILTDQN